MFLSRLNRIFVLFTGALLAIGCYNMHSPLNGGEVCGADAHVRFVGYVPGPNRSVQIQHAATATGPWTNLGTATSASTNGATYDDVTYYRFDKSFQLSKWSSVAVGGAQIHTYVRARVWVEAGFGMPAHWELLDTFDAQTPIGTSPIDCMYQRMQAGDTSLQANDYCKSDEAPVVEVIAPADTTCDLCTEVNVAGDMVIDSARSAARYACTETIGGNFTVTSAAPELFTLPELESVGGNIDFDYSVPVVQYNSTYYRRRFIELPVLETIGGDANLYAKRTDGTKAVPNGLDAVTSVGDITITVYDANPNVFDGLTSHTGNITIQGDVNGGALDVFAGGSFSNLTEVTGDILVHRFFATGGMFMALEQVNGDLTVGTLRFYPSQSFVSLANVTGNFHFVNMKQMGNAWTNTVSVGGELGFIDHTSQATMVIPLVNAQVGSLRIENNATLTTITGNTFQVVGSGGIVIAGNPALSQCQVNTLLAAQQAGGWTGTATVSGTVPCAR